MAILRADGDFGADHDCGGAEQQRRRRTDQEVGLAPDCGGTLRNGTKLVQRRLKAVHFPVARDQRTACFGHHVSRSEIALSGYQTPPSNASSDTPFPHCSAVTALTAPMRRRLRGC